ncbi:MAG: PIN domain-containing protein [Candidatus Thermoplasmatota archaeon]|nr:PIN domain-containing protein [Candidatus Thermoplasmatota archaeon]
MILVMDTNILMSCLISDSRIRRIIASSGFEFYIPDFVLSEIEKHIGIILEKSGLGQEELKELLDNVLTFVEIIPEEEYREHYQEAKDIMAAIDPMDTPFIALALSTINDGVWTNDKHFTKQDRIRIWHTREIIEILKEQHHWL